MRVNGVISLEERIILLCSILIMYKLINYLLILGCSQPSLLVSKETGSGHIPEGRKSYYDVK